MSVALSPVPLLPNTSPSATIALLQSSSLATLVQQGIERSILSGEYAPGSKLVEATLAEKLGVSRGPVRKAFQVSRSARGDGWQSKAHRDLSKDD